MTNGILFHRATAHIEETQATATLAPSSTTGAGECKPEERQVEARSAEDSMASMVRSLYFADTYIINGMLLLSFTC